MSLVLIALALVALVAVVLVVRRGKQRERKRREETLAPLRMVAYEDVTAFGEDLAKLDAELGGRKLDEGATADYQRAIDTYEAAKVAGDSIGEPHDMRHLTEIIEDGRYAVACVRARGAAEPLPLRRLPCFFDPRHGLSVADVPYAPSDGVERQVPACALDTERVRAGADPAARKVMVGAQRVPYWEAGPAYGPYAAGYFGADASTWLFLGSLALGDYSGNSELTASDEVEDTATSSDAGGGFDGAGDFGY
jgi:hypothetical protein